MVLFLCSTIHFVDNGGIVDHHCLEVIVCFVDIGEIVDHHCLEVIVCFVDIGGSVDHHCLNFHFIITNLKLHNTNGLVSINSQNPVLNTLLLIQYCIIEELTAIYLFLK